MNQSVYNPDRTIWSGSKVESIYNSNVSLGYLILSVLKKTPEFVTQVSADTNVEITCVEMRLRTLKIASYLAAAGFKQGDVVGIIASNSENLAPVVFACFTLGLPINPLAPVMTVSDIVYMYSKTKPKAIFCDVTLIETVQKAIEKLPTNPVVYTLSGRAAGFKFVDDILKIDFAEEEFKFPKLTDVSNSTAIILCSSGTTTMPKGVCKSHSQVINQMHSSWNTCELGEVLFNLSSLYWISGVAFLVIGTLYGHQRVITTQAFSPGMMIDIIERFQVTTLFTIPAMVALMLQSNNLSTMMSLRVIISGGAVLAKNLCEAMKQFIPNGIISNIYGVTEGDIVADSFNEQRFGSVGKPSLNVDIKIIDKDGGKLGPNGKGEICYRTKVLFSGYFDDHEMTKETIKNGWVHSGDIGFFDDDGFLFIIDRQKEMLKYNNYHVYPSELETIINEIRGVINSCVVGVFDESKGNDIIFAFVVRYPSRADLTEDFVLKYVNSRVVDAKKMRGGVHFVETLPTTPTGRIRRVEVKKIAKEIYDQMIDMNGYKINAFKYTDYKVPF